MRECVTDNIRKSGKYFFYFFNLWQVKKVPFRATWYKKGVLLIQYFFLLAIDELYFFYLL